ncbi:NAD(P)/FAD-dependent oxidoreductase [uncultured Croceitalea sp.]|uniref:NAD(P)/FAD-dependent oxidoreductase n=1 Tax=uncultured Croceitalea sp. TaxID=1798908 RepID=UPI00330579A7
MKYDVVIIGGGLAGLTAAIHLAKHETRVVVIEKNDYPNHKVCGEYVSNEVKPYLQHLGFDVDQQTSISIDTLAVSTRSGKTVTTKLPLGGFGISRYAFDSTLHTIAKAQGVDFIHDTVIATGFYTDRFQIETTKGSQLEVPLVIGAFGKRSILDRKLDRAFSRQKSPWLGVKCHYQLDDFPEHLVALHNFEGGYGGLSKTETGAVNFCYLTKFESFQQCSNIADFNERVVAKNPVLAKFLKTAVPLFEKPLSIAQISFAKKFPVEQHMLMCGDSAGLIHPLCGNGMAMAIHAAKIAAEEVLCYLKGESKRAGLEQRYAERWKNQMQGRLWMGRQLQRLLMNATASNIAMHTIANSENLLKAMIRQTHGKPILV